MDESLKRRLVGAVVLISLAVIFIPMLVEEEPLIDQGITQSNIPPRPEAISNITSRIQPVEDDTPVVQVKALAPAAKKKTGPKAAQHARTESPKPRVGLSAWVVQVASFGMQENAANLVEQLKAKGFPAFLEQASVDGKAMFRVRVGPEVDQKKAERMQEQIETEMKLKGRVERYP